MVNRPLHAVLLPQRAAGGRLLDALGAALDGSGPAILPLDPLLSRARLDKLIGALRPATLETPQGTEPLAPAGPGGQAGPGVAEDVAVVLATSGSTGRPKGAELTAAALLASARASLDRLGAAGDPARAGRWLCCLPVHHISGLGVLVRSLVTGQTPVVADRLDPDVLAQAGCAYVSLVPTQLRRLLDAGAPLEGLRAILLGGAAIPDGMPAEAAAAGPAVVISYGMTETCGGCVYDGVPLDGVRVASDQDGRIEIAGPVLFARYRLDPGATAAALREGWFVTSDLGGPGEDGRIVVRGRADDVIVTGGEKVVAAEVERVLRGCPGVRDAVVVGAPDPQWGERVTAVIVTDGLRAPSLAALREHVGARLPRYAAPRALAVVDSLPMLASGKPDRQLLKQLAAEDFRHATAGRETNWPVTRYT
ncbi:MAG TPA: AMP-binding protein [Streptosporangiaceae bacterium]|nr:AMP-binding protein [Streptosporangiaceae bacterium]